jgi:hypothetical protein
MTNLDDSDAEGNNDNGRIANEEVEERDGGTSVQPPNKAASGASAPAVEPPPSIEVAMEALGAIKRILKPLRDSGVGYKAAEIDEMLRERLEEMKQFLWVYANPLSDTHAKWMASSLAMAKALGKAPWHARMLRGRCRAFISDHSDLPYSLLATWNETALDQDETLVQEIHAHLQGIGKYVQVMDLVDFLDTDEMRARTGHKNGIDVTTAQRWMKRLNYWWTLDPKGQYVDGHEREDVQVY